MAALIKPMCGLKNFRQFPGLVGFYLQNYVDSAKTPTLKIERLRHLPNKHCKCSYSTGTSSKSVTDEILSSKLSESEKTEEQQSGSDNSKENEEEKKLKMKKLMKRVYICSAVFGTGMFISLVNRWGSPLRDPEGNEIEDEFSNDNVVWQYLQRAWKEVFIEVKTTQKPSRDKLLPDPLTYPYMQPKYTLVLEMTDVLIHPEWTYSTGWRFKKRPGIETFLKAVGPPLFEVVVFTQDNGFTADPIITKIDPENYIMYRLYRDATHFINGHHKKDLHYLNRDLSKVIMIDWKKESVSTNPENAFLLKQYTGADKDTTLGELAEFLRAIATLGVEDVRPVLQYYQQFDDPLKQFRENQRKLKEEQERQSQLQKEAEQSRLAKGFSMSSLLRR